MVKMEGKKKVAKGQYKQEVGSSSRMKEGDGELKVGSYKRKSHRDEDQGASKKLREDSMLIDNPVPKTTKPAKKTHRDQ